MNKAKTRRVLELTEEFMADVEWWRWCREAWHGEERNFGGTVFPFREPTPPEDMNFGRLV